MEELEFTRKGTVIDNRFEVIELLGRGQTGVVVRVLERDTGNDAIALKLLYPHLAQNERTLERFRREVLLMRKLIHPCIARVYNFGMAGPYLYYLSMEYVPGSTLKELLRQEGALSLQDAFHLLLQVASGMSSAHAAQIVHRDLKPDNIFVTPDRRVKILDFGLARIIDEQAGLTATGVSLGTPYYMPPEQFKGEAVDRRSDVYSFGILAFHLLTGRVPFEGETFLKLARQHIETSLPLLADYRADAQPWVQDLIEKCSAKEPKARFKSFTEIIGVIESRSEARARQSLQFGAVVGRLRFGQYRLQKLIDRKEILWSVLFTISLFFWGALLRYQINVHYWGALQPVLWLEQQCGFEFSTLRLLLNVEAPSGPTGLRRAIIRGERDIVLAYLRAGVDPNKLIDGELPLITAVEYSSSTVVQSLLHYGADPNRANAKGRLPLHAAVETGALSSVKALLLGGAEVGRRDGQRNTAYAYLYTGSIKALRGIPIERGALILRYLGREQHRQVPLSLALLGLLLEYGATELQDADGKTPLMRAAEMRDEEGLALLKLRNAKLSTIDHTGRTAEQYLVDQGLLNKFESLPAE